MPAVIFIDELDSIGRRRSAGLAAVAMIHGLSFRLRNPKNLLAKGEEPGITVVLTPTDLDGVVICRRPNPLITPFINSPAIFVLVC